MKLSRHIVFVLFCVCVHAALHAQPGFHVDIDKTKPYQNRKLKAEKTGEGKLKGLKSIWQNLSTHYNYVFNANNKLNDILERAKEQHKDDYAQLLSFYNYDLNTTAADSAQLDSVIYKARTGILNHDLRINWGDELYLLWAASYHLQKKFDSAGLMLQFINYAYAPQFEDGYYKSIGTHTEGAQELSIVSKEEKRLLRDKTFSRNDAFIWRIRTLVEREDFTSAGSLLTTLHRDPAFPKRLQNPLDEVEAFWHYRQQHWDSAAVHLLAALDGDYSKLEKARWRYLAAQMLERARKKDEAAKLYEEVVGKTPDLIMEVYARLNLVRLSKDGGENSIDKNVAELLKMARRDKYEDYRDVIYNMAAQMELERDNIEAASELLIKGSKYSNGNQASRNKAFLQIADVLFHQKKYNQAAAFYDSVQVTDLAEADAKRVADRKPGLQKIVLNNGVVYRQDSLQRVANLPKEERDALIKKTLKRLRKEQGLKEEATATPTSGGPALSASATANQPPADLFSTQQKGEWYFYNDNAKAQGASQFKSNWGTRPNVDNWRRFSAVSQQLLASPDRVVDVANPNAPNGTGVDAGNELSVEGLLGRLPTTPEALKVSNDSIRNALFDLGVAYLNDLEDYPSAINSFEELRRRFPDAEKMDEVLFNLAFAYTKMGNTAGAAGAKKALNEKYPSSRYAAIASTGRDPQAKLTPEATKAYENVYNLFIEGRFADAENAKRLADSTYKTTFWQPQLLYIEAVYNIRQRQDSIAKNVLGTIISQNTNKALTAKAQNLINVLSRRQQIEDELTKLQITRPSDDDSVAAPPQPVVIQKPVEKKDTAVAVKPAPKPAVDSVALAKAIEKKLRDSIAQAGATAKRLRDSLETAQRQLNAQAKEQRAKDRKDSLDRVALLAKQRSDSTALAKQQTAKALRDSLERKALADKKRIDSLATAKLAREQARKDSLALAKALKDQARDSLALRKYLEKKRTDSLAKLRSDSLALVKERNAQARKDSLERVAFAARQKSDSIALARAARDQARRDSLAADKLRKDSLAVAKAAQEQARRDSIALSREIARRVKDSLALAKRIQDSIAKKSVSPLGYAFEPNMPHYAVVVLDKVDPIFVNEAKNAFFRYNQEKYYNQQLDVQILNLTSDTRLLLISGLPTAAAATDYVTKTKALAPTEIVPWLTGNKYNFSIISARNLDVLKANADFSGYKKFLEQVLPGKF